MFHFKRFSVEDSCSAMKVGTDGVLIGAWCSVGSNVRRVLDIGTGSGVIALMLAQRCSDANIESVNIDAIDIDPQSAAQAKDNLESSPWSSNVSIYCCDFQSFESDCKYDLIVSNPPYFIDSLLPPNAERGVARHTTELSFEDLVDGVVRLLNRDGGRFAVVLPIDESRTLDAIVEHADANLRLVRRCAVRNSADKPMKRYMSEYLFAQGNNIDSIESSIDSSLDEVLFIREGSPLEYSERYKMLTSDFYLKF